MLRTVALAIEGARRGCRVVVESASPGAHVGVVPCCFPEVATGARHTQRAALRCAPSVFNAYPDECRLFTLTRAPHLDRDWARPCHICARTGLTPSTSAPGLGSPRPHLHRDWAHPVHICAGTGLTAATSAPGLGSPLPHLHRTGRTCPCWATTRHNHSRILLHLRTRWPHFVDSAFIRLKPATDTGSRHASVPPATITSASPYLPWPAAGSYGRDAASGRPLRCRAVRVARCMPCGMRLHAACHVACGCMLRAMWHAVACCVPCGMRLHRKFSRSEAGEPRHTEEAHDMAPKRRGATHRIIRYASPMA